MFGFWGLGESGEGKADLGTRKEIQEARDQVEVDTSLRLHRYQVLQRPKYHPVVQRFVPWFLKAVVGFCQGVLKVIVVLAEVAVAHTKSKLSDFCVCTATRSCKGPHFTRLYNGLYIFLKK